MKHEHGIELVSKLADKYQAIVLTVAHNEFLDLPFAALKVENGVIFDIKSILSKDLADARL